MKSKLLLFMMLFWMTIAYAQQPRGVIKGKVIDVETKKPIVGVNVIIMKTQLGAATDDNGDYYIPIVPVGNYSVAFHHIGFEKVVKTDVIVRSERTTFLNAELREVVLESNELVVNANYFPDDDSKPISIAQFNAEEIRRAPGSAGDISRLLTALPSIAKVSDYSNDLMVRGGSPFENAFFIDNIQINNINHFPVHGASGGTIGMINVDFINDVTFHSGGFSATYGDRLSSVVDIQFRDGNPDQYEAQMDLNMSGFGGIVEGPLARKKGSWFLSGRRSYLDLIVDAIGTGVAPRYGDIHGKLTYNINPQHKITLLNIFGNSEIHFTQKQAEDNGQPSYGDNKTNQNTLGANWRWLWNHKGYSNTSLSYSFAQSKDLWFDVNTKEEEHGNNYLEGSLRVRNINYYQLNHRNKIEFGLDAAYEMADYDYFFAPYINPMGKEVLGLKIKDKHNSAKTGFFTSYIWSPFSNLTTTIGLRGDYLTYNEQFTLSPRFSSIIKLNERLSVNGAFGIFYQSLPMFILSQDDKNKELKNPKSIHTILGLNYQLTPDTRLTIELYDKKYSNFPLEPDNPYVFVVDEGRTLSNFKRYTQLHDWGKAYSRGVELLVQKKLAQDFYGLVSASVFRCRYQDYEGKWRNRPYDNQYLFNIIGGYKPNKKWEFSINWSYAGGVPYTPFDIEQSKMLNTGIIDQTQINTKRYPDYHSLNIRMDRRFFFNRSSLVVFFNIWNAYNRKNVAMYYWNEVDNEQQSIYQWSFIPIIGVEWEL